MKRAVMVALPLLMALAALALARRDHERRDLVDRAFDDSRFTASKPAVAEAARIAPYPDFGAEMFAAAALRDWLASAPDSRARSKVGKLLAERPPWGYPHPWRWPLGDYASEYLAAIAELEAGRSAKAAPGANLERARALMIDALTRRPGWPQHRRALESVLIAEGR